MLRDDIERFTQLSGEDGAHTPIIRIGSYLDGYDKAMEKIDEMIAEIEDKICSFNYFASEVTTRDAILKIINKYCDKEQKNE